MEENSKVYRIRTKVGEDSPNVIHVPINQTYDTFEILSLKLNQTDTYKTYESGYGIIVGRVIANGGFGVPNSKVSVFIEVDDNESLKDTLFYNFTSTSDTDNDGVRYNLLPDYVEAECHQDVGTFPNKRLVLDNDDVIEIFDKYWKYTTTTNNSGDYMLFGIPTGSQQLHVDIDLSDCGVLSQRPHNMIGKGYDIGMFESPNKFKSSTNLNSLPQIVTEDRGVYVYPYWGDTSNGDNTFAITRCDINIEYKFEPTAVFMGSIITDKGSNAIGKNCTATINNGKMSELVTGEGTIEMIRKTIDGRVEQFPIMGNRLIDGDGTWVYEIPMNLDYVTTDEFGNFVPTDNPDKGIATRARVRFRVRLDDTQYDNTARKRACYLIPNNPRLEDEGFDKTMEVDYEFGSLTREESYRDLFWNKVYTVKSYIPKIQKGDEQYNRQHTGIKWVNHANQNNPMPYNTLTVKLSFVHRIICILTGLVVQFVAFINQIISLLGFIFATLFDLPSVIFNGLGRLLDGKMCIIPFTSLCIGSLLAQIFYGIGKGLSSINILGRMATKFLTPRCIALDSGFCDDNVNKVDFYPGCGYFLFNLFPLSSATDVVERGDIAWEKTQEAQQEKYNGKSSDEVRTASNHTGILHNCYENALAQENEATSFNFNNDWINGTLYAPLWYRKITPKKRFFFGLFSRKAKDEWCTSKQYFPSLRYIQHCAVERDGSKTITNFDGDTTDLKFIRNSECEDGDCHERHVALPGLSGVIHSKQTMLGQEVYYYKPVEWSANLPSNELYRGKKKGELKLLFATDIVLLGSLDSCDMNGIPQFFKNLESTTYNMPGDILFTDYEFHYIIDPETGNATSNYNTQDYTVHSEMAGCDWGNPNEFNKKDGGLFYGIGCTNGETELYAKSCVNLSRICEYGVSLDVTKEIPLLDKWEKETTESEIEQAEDGTYYKRLITDGYISWDELYNLDERSMFATMNGNQLKTKINTKNGLKEYDFRYLYPENFDGSLAERMKRQTQNYPPEINYKFNYLLEKASRDYYLFRMGNKPYYYDSNNAFPRYENSFYFYFGLNEGKTAIEKFNSKYFAECDNEKGVYNNFNIYKKSSSWCSSLNETYDGFVALDLEKIATPYSIVITGDNTFTLDNISDEKIIFYNKDYTKPEGFDDYELKKFEEFEKPNTFIPNGAYYLTITDANEEEYHYELDMSYNFLMYSNNVQSFKKNHEDLLRSLGTNNAIMNDNTKLVYSNPEKIEREIGGVITVYGVHDNDGDIDTYRIEVREKVDFDITDIQKTIEKEGDIWYDADGEKHIASSEDVDKIVEDYASMTKKLVVPEWYDKDAVKHYLTEKDEGTQQADFNPLVKELKEVGDTWYDADGNFCEVTSIANGKIHYTINGEGNYTIDGDTWYDADGNFCEVTSIDTDGKIHYTKNGESGYTIVGRNTVVDYTDWTLELNLPTYYNKNGDKQNYSYQPNKETSVVDFELSDRLKKITSVVSQGNEEISVDKWSTLTPAEQELYEVYQYVNKQDSSAITIDAYNQRPDGYSQKSYEEVYVKNDGTEILTKDVWETLDPDVQANYTKMYCNKYIETNIITPDEWAELPTEYCKGDYVKMYRNKYDIIHYTKNGEGDYRGRATWYDADGVEHTASSGDIGKTVVDYTDWVLELTPPTWYDLDGYFCEVTKIVDGTIHYTKNVNVGYAWYNKEGDNVYIYKVTRIVPQDEEILTVEQWSALTSTKQGWYAEVYVNRNDETDIRSKEQWEALGPDEQTNYTKMYRNKYGIIHYNINGEGDNTIVDFTISGRKTVTEVTFNSSLENAPYLEYLYNLYKGDIYVEKKLLGVDYVEYGISYKVISPYALTSDDYNKLTEFGKFDYEPNYINKIDLSVITIEDYDELPDDYGQKSYDVYNYINKDDSNVIDVDTYNQLPDYNQDCYEEAYVNRDDETVISKEEWESIEDPVEKGKYEKKYKNKYDDDIITPDEWAELSTDYCKHDYEVHQYVNKTDSSIITKDAWESLPDSYGKRDYEVHEYVNKQNSSKITIDTYNQLPDGYGQNHYKEEPAYCKIENKIEYITKEEYDDNVDIQFLYQQFHVLNENENNILIENGYDKTLKEEDYDNIIVNYEKLSTKLENNSTIYFTTKEVKDKKNVENWSYNGTEIPGDYIIDYVKFLTPLEDGDYYYTYDGIRKTYIDETPNNNNDNNELDFTSLVRVLSFETWLDEDGALCEVTSVVDGTIYYTKNGVEKDEHDNPYTIVGRNTVINYNQPIWTKTTRSDDNYSWVDKNGVTQYEGAETLVVDYSWLLETTTQEEIVWYDKEGNAYKVTEIVGSTIHYTKNGEVVYIDKNLGDIVVDFNHDSFILILDDINDVWYDEDGNFCEVTSITPQGEKILTVEQWNSLSNDEKALYDEVYVNKTDSSIIISKEEWEALAPVEQDNYNKMYRNKVVIIHYTMNGEGDYTILGRDTVVNYYKFMTEPLYLPTWYDADGNLYKVTSIIQQGKNILTDEQWSALTPTEQELYEVYEYVNRDDEEDIITKAEWEGLSKEERANYKPHTYVNKVIIIYYTKNGEEKYKEGEEYKPYIIVDRDTVVDWSEYIGYEGAEITYDNGVITNITNVLWYDSEKQSFAFGVPDENRTYIITVTQICDGNDTNNEIKTNVFVSGVIKYKMFINGIDYEIIKNFDGHTGWNYNGTITKNKLTTNVSDLNENNPWFNVDKIYYHNNFGVNNDYPEINLKDIERFGIDKNESEQTYAIYATEIDKEDEEVGKKVNETYHGEDGKNKIVKANDVIATFVKERNEDDVTTYKVIDFTVKNLMFVGETWYDEDGNLCKVTSVVPQGKEVISADEWSALAPTQQEWYDEVYVNKQVSNDIIEADTYNQLPDYNQDCYEEVYVKNDGTEILMKEQWEELDLDEQAKYIKKYKNKYDENDIITPEDWAELTTEYCKRDYAKMYRNKYVIIHYTKNGGGDYRGRVSWYDADGVLYEVTSIVDDIIHYTKNGDGDYTDKKVGDIVVDYSNWVTELKIRELKITEQQADSIQYVNKQVSTDFITTERYNQLPDGYSQESYDVYRYVNRNDEENIITKEQWEDLSEEERANYKSYTYINKYNESDIISSEDWDNLPPDYCKGDYEAFEKYFKQYSNKEVSTDYISPETYNQLPKYNQNSYVEVYVNKQDSSVIMPEEYNQLPDYNKDSYEEVYVNRDDETDIRSKEQWEALESVEERAKYAKMYRNKYDTTKIITPDQWDNLPSVYCQEDYTKMYRNEHDTTKFITSEEWGKLPKYCQEDYTEVYLSTWYDKNGTLNYMLPSEDGQKRIDFRPLVKTIENEGDTWYDVNSVKRVAGSDDIGQEVLDYSKENNGLTELKEITFETSDKTWYDKNGIVNEADSDKLGLYIDITYMTKGDDTTLFNIYNEEYIDKLVIDKVVIDKVQLDKYANKQDSNVIIDAEVYDELPEYNQDCYDEVYVKNDGTEILTKEQWEELDLDERANYIKKYKNKYDENDIITPVVWGELPTDYCKRDYIEAYTYQYDFNKYGLHNVRIYLVQKPTYGDLLSDVIDFNGCSDLNTIVLPNIGITTIGDSAFNGCKSLTSIDLPDSITTIGANAFKDCEKLSSVYIPYNVTTIGANAFNGCKSLTNIVLPENITTIGDSAFANCEKLQSVRAEMEDVTNNTVGTNAFDNTNIGLIIYVPMDKDGHIYGTSDEYNKAGWGNDVQDKVVAIELTVFNYNKVNINPSDLLDEFARNTGGNTVYYNFIDSYVAGEYKAFTQVTYFKASDFVNAINNVLSRRREIADRMFNTFYMTQEGESKSFNITSNTDEMPVQPIIVYHEEEIDDVDIDYTLTTPNLVYEQINMLKNVNIPTITYKSSPFFGDGTSSDDIIITKSNNIEKKPSSTGIMNVKQKSIPLDSGNKDFPSISLSGGVKAINPSKTNIADLFEFPVIDKIESSSVSGWTKFSNIPSPNPNNIGMINMDGYVYGRHNNGVVERDGNFEIRKLGKYEINLSENLNGNVENSTKPYTYAERRVITGLTNYSIAQWCIVKLRSIVQADDVTEETLKNIWKMLFNPTNEEDEPTYDKEKLLEVIDTMTVVKQTIDEDLVVYIQCDETIGVTPNKWKIDQGDENCITNSLIQFKNFNVVVSNDNDKKRQYAFTVAKKANLNIGEINENFNFDNELKLSTEVESIDVSGQSQLNIPSLTKLSFNQGEKEGGHYQLFGLSRYRDGFYGEEDMNQYPIYNATKNGIVYQIDNVQEETMLSHEGEISKINNKEKQIQGTFNEEYHSSYFHSMYKFKGSNDDERVWRDAESTNGLYIAQENFNRSKDIPIGFGNLMKVSNDYFLNPKYIRHVYCVYVKGNMKMLSPLYEFAPTQLVGTCGNLQSYDGRDKSVIGVKVNDYARIYFKNYDYTLGGPFKIKRKKIYIYDYLTYTIPEGTIKYKDEEYYYNIVNKLEDDVYTFEYNMGWKNEGHNFHEDHVIAKDITDLRHLTWTNGNELKRDEFILINWEVPESDSFRFISEQKNTETEDFVELATVEKVYRKGQILTRLPKNNGQYKDNDEWTIQYKGETGEPDEKSTTYLLNGKFIIDRPCIITKKI